MDEFMDSDDETMFAALMEEEAEIAVADDEEHLMMMSCLMALYARTDAKPRRRGSAPGRRKSKPRQRLEGYCILYADYFADDPLHGDVVSRRRFWMSDCLFVGKPQEKVLMNIAASFPSIKKPRYIDQEKSRQYN
jgi:hypothetical protein